MRPPATVLELDGLKVSRGGVEVLDVPSFRLGDGEFVSLIGPNGAGKSTLLLAMMSLLDRAAGRLLWRGVPIASGAEIDRRRRMSMVLQEPLLLDTSVHENVAAGLKIRRLGRDEVRRRTGAALERFRLTGLAQRAARTLSGGEARRVSLARALAVEPEVLLLDEPFGSLDLPTRQAITDDLEATLRDTRTAAILVTHDQAEALRLSDRIVVMRGGRIVQDDVPAAVMNEPVDPFVAAVVGMETILEGLVRRSTGWEIAVEVAGEEIDAVGAGSPGEAVYCCIRPENVVLDVVDPAGTSSARNVFPARIASVASVGPYLKVKLDCGFPLVAHVTAESFAALRLAAGKSVFASFKATAIHVIRRAEARPRPPV